MVWYNLKIGNWNLKYTPLNPIEKEYPICDEKGNILEKINGKFEKGHYLNQNKEKVNITFRLINNKPYSKLIKTKPPAGAGVLLFLPSIALGEGGC